MPKVIVVLPVFNEGKTLPDMLKRIDRQADMLVCVNDGSQDDSLTILREFARKRKETYIVNLPRNTGMAGALKHGFLFVLFLLQEKKAGPDDIVVTIDADGQHKPEYISLIVPYMLRKGADVVLTRRDFSAYPIYKVLGNRFLTLTNSLLSGHSYRDVESGLRFLKARTLRPILMYYTGFKYSCAQEIALISARLGFKIDNDYLVEIAYYRAGTTVLDGFIVLFLSLLAYGRWLLKWSSDVHSGLPLFQEAYRSSRLLWKRKGKRN